MKGFSARERMRLSTLIVATLAGALLPIAVACSASTGVDIDASHEDPAAAESDYDIGLSILWHYADALSLLGEGEYQDLRALIEQIDKANIPDDIKYVMQTYNGLLSDLSENFDSLDVVLNEAELLLGESRLEEARLKLAAAGEPIEEARVLLADINEGMEEVIRLLGPLASSAEVEAKTRLREATQSLEEHQSLYEALLQRLEAEGAELEQVSPTHITLGVDKSQVWVGETLTVSGMLTSIEEGKGLPGKEIRLLLDDGVTTTIDADDGATTDLDGGLPTDADDEISATATTDAGGLYQAIVDVPCRYVKSMTVRAEYVPEGEDISEYQFCSSDSVDINTCFCQTHLDIEVPELSYLGLPLKIEGEIGYEDGIPPVERQIKVLLDDELLATFYCPQDAFQMEATLDAGIEVGEHTLMVTVEAQEHYSDAFRDRRLTIVKGLPEIRIDKANFMTLTRKMRIGGQLLSGLPLQGGIVTIKLGDASTVVSASADGEFEASLSLPLGSVVIGSQEVTVTAEPFEEWHLSAETKTKVFVVDIAKLGPISVALISIGVVLYSRTRGSLRKRESQKERGRVRKRGVKMTESSFLPEESTAIPPQKPELEGNKGRILKAYAEAQRAVENATGIAMKPSMTLREFSKAYAEAQGAVENATENPSMILTDFSTETRPKLNDTAKAFADLTRLAEKALYSPYAPELDEVLEAESLALTVEEMLR